ncbi:MAG: acetyltransferase-like isoleucine patch superfamily enzyme [Kiritimatiellia bacterium]|jgi:acetyltransferase-like isoleucine patch superfamily enzyme
MMSCRNMSAIVKELLGKPWKRWMEPLRLCYAPFIFLYCSLHGVKLSGRWRMYGFPLIQRHCNSRIQVGEGLDLRNWFSSNPLGVRGKCILCTYAEGAEILIGNNTGMTGATVCAMESIHIGSDVRIGANSTIVDTDFHPLGSAERATNPKDGRKRPVVIEDEVFIGMNVLILKGSHIGKGSVIGAGSVVSGTIPPGVIAAGNPIKVIREMDHG